MTARNLTAASLAAMQGTFVRPALFFEGEFSGGTVRLWTGPGSILWDNKNWVGDKVVGITDIEETATISASGVTVTLSGVNPDLVAVAIDEARQGLPGRIWIGFIDSAGDVIVDPYASFTGRMDVPTITDAADTVDISLTYESRLIDLLRPRELRYTHETQQMLHPGDLGFEYVAAIQEKEITWGRPLKE